MDSVIDVVTVFHNENSKRDSLQLQSKVTGFPGIASHYLVDNTIENRGFAKGCNLGASFGSAPIVGFLNPDVDLLGDFCPDVIRTINSGATITGESFGKSKREIRIWGCSDWVCGAAMFVDRAWFESVGGFDERFVWSWEETALIRLAERQGKRVKSIHLPISHQSPSEMPVGEAEYKNKWFDHGQKLFYQLYPRRVR